MSVASLKQWFAGLQPQEQRALKLLGVFLLVVGVWLKLWLPLQQTRNENAAMFHRAAAELAWMQAHSEEAKAAPQANAPSPSDVSLLSLSSDAAQLYHLAFSHAEPSQDGSLHVSLEHVPFSRFLNWLDVLAREHGVVAMNVSVERNVESEGFVNATVILQKH